jgi:hypothetical protein
VDYHGDPKGIAMKLTTISLATASLAAAVALSVNFANAQSGVPSVEVPQPATPRQGREAAQQAKQARQNVRPAYVMGTQAGAKS